MPDLANDEKYDGTYITAPSGNFFTISPDNANNLPHTTRTIYVGGVGDIKIDGAVSGVGVVILNLQVGWHPIRARKVYNAGTTATGLIGGW